MAPSEWVSTELRGFKTAGNLVVAPASRACSGLHTTVVFGTAIPRDVARRTVSSLLNARRTSSWAGSTNLAPDAARASRWADKGRVVASLMGSNRGPGCWLANSERRARKPETSFCGSGYWNVPRHERDQPAFDQELDSPTRTS